MKNSFCLRCYFSLALVLIFAGCNLEQRKDDAAEKARDYIFENIPHISPQNSSYIRYTYPKIVKTPIYTTAKRSEKQDYWNWGFDYYSPVQFSKSREFSQVAFTWDLPDPKISVMVLGTCYDNYQGWYPIKLILRPTEIAAGPASRPEEEAEVEPDTIIKPVAGKSPSDEDFEKISLP